MMREPWVCPNCSRLTYRDQRVERPGRRAICKLCNELAKARRTK